MRQLTTKQGAHGQRRSIVKYFFALPVVALLFGLIFFTTPNAFAENEYSCGTYGAGNYGASCPDEPVDPGDGGNGGNNGGSNGGSSNPGTGTGSGSSSGGNASSGGSSAGGSSNTGGDTSDGDGVMPTPTDGTILLNSFSSYSSQTGKELDLKVDQVVYFVVNGERHSITIKQITDKFLIVTIASTPKDVTINKGETVEHDVNDDGVNDISISYLKSAEETASVNFWQLSPETDDEQVVTTEAEGASLLWLWIAIAVVGVLVIVITAVAAKRRKNNA